MSEEMLVKYCSPTIRGIKTGNMFSCRFANKDEEHKSLCKINQKLSSKGLRIIPLRKLNGSTLLYVYRPSKLGRDLKDKEAEQILKEKGYVCGSTNRYIAQLIQRLKESENFPHEIGLFLGYPPEDVCGFIENRAEGCKCVGCWKVYGDVDKAQAVFDKYKKCTQLCCSLIAKGCTIEKLTVSC